jgi:hypothetical protein
MENIVFTVTSGRSGTLLLSNLMKLLPDTTSLHEPEPSFDYGLRRLKSNPFHGKVYIEGIKLPAIEKYDTKWYIETTHSCSKGFIEIFWAMGIMPKLIFLRRPPTEVAASLYRMGSIPGRSWDSYRHNVNPDDRYVMSMPGWELAHDYQLCYWYALECERLIIRYQIFQKKLHNPIVNINMMDLRNWGKFSTMCNQLGYTTNDLAQVDISKYKEIIGTNQNSRDVQQAIDFDVKPLEQQVWDSINLVEPLLQYEVYNYWKQYDENYSS